jgi:predicted alpha/beta-fold hydrolase
MNISGLRLLSFFRVLPTLRISPRRVILSFTGTTILTSLLYPQWQSKFGLYYQDTENNNSRIEKCPTIKNGTYYPTPYLAHGMLQALYGANTTECDSNLQFSEETLDLPCGGKIGLHWGSLSNKQPAEKKNVVVIVLPGLTASAREPYVKNMASEALENGYEVVVYHNRGNEVEMILPQEGFYNPMEDFKLAVDFVKEKYPSHTIFAIGHSFGANTLVNYLGRYNQDHTIKAAASIANPFDFVKAAQGILNTSLDKYLAESLQIWAKRNQNVLSKAPKHFNLEFDKAMAAKSIVGFDEYITRRILGFSNYSDYYEAISSARVIPNIQVPLLCMHSRDDPVLSEASIPIQESLANENVTMLVTNHGGHVGWFQGFLKPKRWFPKPTMEFLNACYDEINVKN